MYKIIFFVYKNGIITGSTKKPGRTGLEKQCGKYNKTAARKFPATVRLYLRYRNVIE